ncbi:short-chain dehydrogenase/reductase [Aspergillus sclerotioniger CBS 115572]|uniref:Short-chain dehydrogenase/reductase n=1 Tax=Aspergillus sclerotioniger CBS 115572 TaxID=1450535 RepID=A0A317WL52_9EURO|nr:short-chain dehydrogenase/reductase [Aspergillus sclerotioniger CBS 115572]PWY87214.1 short-chain dehydrogenase/reductase [Aspergillus sclerotioniger CBS 115572]
MFFSCNKSVAFNPESDIPSLAGKVILQCILEYARHSPSQIWLAARNPERCQAAADEIRQKVPNVPIRILEMDLASFDSIQKAAQTVLTESDRLDILMLNAGVMAVPPGLTKDGYEIEFGTNHMGHALLTKLLMPLLLKTTDTGAEVRVVSMTSTAFKQAPKDALDFPRLRTTAEDMGGFGRYSQSKLANILWARHLAKVYPQLTVASVHPGLVQTELMDRASEVPAIMRAFRGVAKMMAVTVDQGAKNQLWASVSEQVKSGEYYEPIGVSGQITDNAKDDQLAEKLWDWTQKELES